MELKKNTEPEKLRGAYFTPEAITTPVVRMIRAAGWAHGRVLEPSCGDGAFLKPLSKKMVADLEIDAVELNDESFEIVNERFARLQGFNLYHGDFFDFIKTRSESTYDLVIGNPPYIRYQYLTEEQRSEIGKIFTANGLRVNKLVNAWVGFVVACIQLLKDGGHLVFHLKRQYPS